jgi:hypothetical protein
MFYAGCEKHMQERCCKERWSSQPIDSPTAWLASLDYAIETSELALYH